MKLTDIALKELRAIYSEEYGQGLSEAEANEMGLRLLGLFKTIYKQIPQNEMSLNEKLHTNR